MPTNIIRPFAVGNVDTTTLALGANKVVAVDSGDPVTHDDATTYIQGELGVNTTYKLTNIPVGLAAVLDYRLGIRADNLGEGACSEDVFARITTTNASAAASVNGTGWTTGGPTTTPKPGGGSWKPTDFIENDNVFQFGGRINGDAIIAFPRISTLWGELDYITAGATIALFVSAIVPPLVTSGLLGGQLLHREVMSALQLLQTDVYPLTEYDWDVLWQALRVRPSYNIGGVV